MKLRTALATALFLFATSTSYAESVNIGTMRCIAGEKVGLIITAKIDLNCVFQPNQGPAQSYIGFIREFGLDIGATNETEISWTVIAPGMTQPGALEGDYAGVTASATAAAGAGANVLVGGSGRSYTLQPLSVQVQSGGLNIAAAVQSMKLRYSGQ